MSFGAKVAEYRKHSGLGQEEFARRVGLHGMHLIKIEKDKNSPPGLATILLMIGVLNLSSEEAVNFLQEAGHLQNPLNISSVGDIKELAESLEAFEAIARAMEILQEQFKAMRERLLGEFVK